MLKTSIDFNFVKALEGDSLLDGYVPYNGSYVIGNSGVTVGAGVDVGQMSIEQLRKLLDKIKPFPLTLYAKLVPYAGLRGDRALRQLSNKPLKLNREEADTLDSLIQDNVVSKLVGFWDSYGGTKFDELPAQIQTVLYSLAYNFGTNLPDKLPNTWLTFKKGALTNDWGETYNYMLNFPSKQRELRKRRLKEAMLIYELLPI